MGGLLRPPIGCRVPIFKKKYPEPYSRAGFSDFFSSDILATFSATFSATLAKVSKKEYTMRIN